MIQKINFNVTPKLSVIQIKFCERSQEGIFILKTKWWQW
jgi:hypothetical protein